IYCSCLFFFFKQKTAYEMRISDWSSDVCSSDLLDRRVRYRSGDGSALLIDPSARSYHGPAALKSLAAGLKGTVQRTDFEDIDDAAWASESAKAGDAQPLQRLQWLDALVAGSGELLPGYDPDGCYKLNKWPQTEREYPRHFRIATAMMKGPATLAEIAGASGMPVADVADFVNASLATGVADIAPNPPPEPAEPPPPTAMGGRLGGQCIGSTAARERDCRLVLFRSRSVRLLQAQQVAAARARIPAPLPHRHGDDEGPGHAGGDRRCQRHARGRRGRFRQCKPGDGLCRHRSEHAAGAC